MYDWRYKMKLNWNVFLYDSKSKQIGIYNIFNRSKFREDVEEILSLGLSRDGFDSRLEKILFHYFWCKSEYDVIISPWIGNDSAERVDIYTQVKLNWRQFSDYVWSFKK